MKEFWDKRYEKDGWVYGQEPNVFFQEVLSRLPPGRILLPAEGEGRNAIFSARTGWEVEAFDFSPAAKQKALTWAKEENLVIQYELQDLTEWNPLEEVYDVVSLIFIHLEPTHRVDFHQKVIKSVKKGGIVIIEAFRPEQVGHSSGGPQDPRMLYTLVDLENDFMTLEKVSQENWSGYLDEGQYHRGHAETIRMVFQKN